MIESEKSSPTTLVSQSISFVYSSVLWRQKYVTEDREMPDEDVELVLLEILRLFASFFWILRVAAENFELDNVHVSKGEKIKSSSS